MDRLFFTGWESLLRTAVICITGYFLLIIFLRASGKRTLSKMNAFDLIVTIALGSTLATVILNKNVALADGAVAFFLLIYLQYFITFLASRKEWINNLVKSKPTMLMYKGELFTDQMKKERVHRDEIYAVIRQQGLSSLDEADAVILETDGTLTVVKELKNSESSVMKSVERTARVQELKI